MIIRKCAYARAGLVGNPSDGYYGKTIAFIIRNYSAEVTLWETPELEILPTERDHSTFQSIDDLVDDVGLYGYYGGIRLLKATVKRFRDYCKEHDILLEKKNFTIRYSSNIPNRVGMAGSSGIITACLRCLMEFYGVEIPQEVQPGLILSVETQELGIPAGLQDRVIQVYEGVVHMDFEKAHMEEKGYGRYTPLDPSELPSVYVAYRKDLSEGTEVFHNDIRSRWRRAEPEVVEAMRYWAGLADQVRDAMQEKNHSAIGPLLDANFERRRQLYQLSEGNIRMVETARSTGASAKFTGSGGAIVGTYADDSMFDQLKQALEPLGIVVIKPQILSE